jgi:hypothetical protein
MISAAAVAVVFFFGLAPELTSVFVVTPEFAEILVAIAPGKTALPDPDPVHFVKVRVICV